jgi:hypothetical protein
MFAPQVHLMLNHVPVLGALFGAVALVVALRARNDTMARFALAALVVAAIAAAPVYLSGGLSEGTIEKVAGVQEGSIERHEGAARVATVAMAALGLGALVALLRFRRRPISPPVASTLLVLALALTGVLAWTAHLGGEIRHAEIRSGVSTASVIDARTGAESERESDEH